MKPWSDSIEHTFEIGSASPDGGFGTLHLVLLSDRDLIHELKSGRLQLDPFEPALVQPSSIDVRLDRWFRVFNNHLYTHLMPESEARTRRAVDEIFGDGAGADDARDGDDGLDAA